MNLSETISKTRSIKVLGSYWDTKIINLLHSNRAVPVTVNTAAISSTQGNGFTQKDGQLDTYFI